MLLNDAAYAREQTLAQRFPSSEGEAGAAAAVQLGLRIRGGLPPRAMRRVREFIEAHLERTISIQELAEIAGLSMHHFARAFKQSEGMTPHDYLLRCRERRAQDLPPASCSRCQAHYWVVRTKAEPGVVHQMLHCKVCQQPLPSVESGDMLKYFLVGRPRLDRG